MHSFYLDQSHPLRELFTQLLSVVFVNVFVLGYLLISVHEYGHYLVGKFLGLTPTHFRVGSGKAVHVSVNGSRTIFVWRIFPNEGGVEFKRSDVAKLSHLENAFLYAGGFLGESLLMLLQLLVSHWLPANIWTPTFLATSLFSLLLCLSPFTSDGQHFAKNIRLHFLKKQLERLRRARNNRHQGG